MVSCYSYEGGFIKNEVVCISICMTNHPEVQSVLVHGMKKKLQGKK